MSKYIFLTSLFLSQIAYAGPAEPHPHPKVCFDKYGPKPCKKNKAPPPKPVPPDDTNTCTPSPPTCTGQWCTSCDEQHCMDFDGPGISASLCDGELSWCGDDECGSSGVEHLEDLAVLQATDGSSCRVVHGPGGCTLTCGDVHISCFPIPVRNFDLQRLPHLGRRTRVCGPLQRRARRLRLTTWTQQDARLGGLDRKSPPPRGAIWARDRLSANGDGRPHGAR
jgi:hypothetical protein